METTTVSYYYMSDSDKRVKIHKAITLPGYLTKAKAFENLKKIDSHTCYITKLSYN